jgi:hypothetical protein
VIDGVDGGGCRSRLGVRVGERSKAVKVAVDFSKFGERAKKMLGKQSLMVSVQESIFHSFGQDGLRVSIGNEEGFSNDLEGICEELSTVST